MSCAFKSLIWFALSHWLSVRPLWDSLSLKLDWTTGRDTGLSYTLLDFKIISDWTGTWASHPIFNSDITQDHDEWRRICGDTASDSVNHPQACQLLPSLTGNGVRMSQCQSDSADEPEPWQRGRFGDCSLGAGSPPASHWTLTPGRHPADQKPTTPGCHGEFVPRLPLHSRTLLVVAVGRALWCPRHNPENPAPSKVIPLGQMCVIERHWERLQPQQNALKETCFSKTGTFLITDALGFYSKL